MREGRGGGRVADAEYRRGRRGKSLAGSRRVKTQSGDHLLLLRSALNGAAKACRSWWMRFLFYVSGVTAGAGGGQWNSAAGVCFVEVRRCS